MKKRILSLLLVLQLMLSICPVYTSADAGSVLCEGSPVSSLEMYMGDSLTLQSGLSGAYQWQIEAMEGFWVNINGETGAELRVSYGMLANVLRGDCANIRCSVDLGGNVEYTAPVSIRVSYEDASASEQQEAPEKPEVLPAPVAVENAAPEVEEEIPAAPVVNPEEAIAAAQAQLDKANAELDSAKAILAETTAAMEAAILKATEAEALVDETAVSVWQNAKTVAEAAANNYAAAEGAYLAAEAAALAEPENEELAAAMSAAAAALETAAAEKTAAEDALAQLAAAVDISAYENLRLARAESNAAALAHENAVALCAAKEQAVNDAAAALESAKTAPAVVSEINEPVMMFAARPATFAAAPAIADEGIMTAGEIVDETLKKYLITIDYIYADTSIHKGEAVAYTWSAELPEGAEHSVTVASPIAPGYEADQSEIVIDLKPGELTGNISYTVRYSPALMEYPVYHYRQNADNDAYSLFETGTASGYTEQETPAYGTEGSLAKQYEGFRALPYITDTIAADGSTELVVYYDRNYYLMYFELDEGGYGVDPIYARYGSSINVADTPVRPGYTFKGWLLNGETAEVETTMPAYNLSYVADWELDATAPVSVVFWGENPNDEEYSYIGSEILNLKPGKEIYYTANGLMVCANADHRHTNACYAGLEMTMDAALYNFVRSDTVVVEPDGSSVINVYFDRKQFTLTFKASNKVVATITEKWGASISGEFLKAPFNTTYNGQPWSCTEYSKYGYALQTLDTMPKFDATFNVNNPSSKILKTIYYYLENVGANASHSKWPSSTQGFTLDKQVDTYFNFSTYEEEYHEIEGFTRYTAKIAGFESSRKYFENNKLNFYYLRNSYQLDFNNGFSVDKSETVEYGAALSAFEDYTPKYPSQYEAGTRYFDGWYLNPECTGEKFELSSHTMPSNDLILYAKWTPYYYQVKVYTDVSKTEQIGQTVEIMHGKFAQEPEYDKQSYGEDYEFIAWFYTDENGKEQAYDFANMPVKRPLEIYAKWKSNLIRDITVMYVVLNADGSETEIAQTEIQRAYVGEQKTFDAKISNQLYEQYREGFYPAYASSSVLVDADESKNVVKFVYQQTEPAPYTVEYWIKNEDGSLRPAFRNNNGKPEFVANGAIAEADMYVKRITDNRKSVVTENHIPIENHVPDALQKKLIITTSEENNLIRFIYSHNPTAGIYTVNHYIAKPGVENPVRAEDYELYTDSQIPGTKGQSYSAKPISIPGFTHSAAVTSSLKGSNSYDAESKTLSGVLKDNSLALNFYYVRNLYPYEVRYVDADTGLTIAPTKQSDAAGNALTAPYGSTVVESAIKIDGYNVDSAKKSAVIKIASNSYQNPIVFLYSSKTANIEISKTVVLAPDKAAMGLTLPAGWENLEFSFTVSSAEPLHKQSYTGTITGTNGSREIVLAKVGDKQLESVGLRHGESLVVKGLALGSYTVTESRVTGYSPSVNGKGSTEIDLELKVENETVPAAYTNTYPYYTGDLVLEKRVNKLDESDPDANTDFVFTVKLTPAQGTLDEARPIRLGDSIVYTIGAGDYWAEPHSFTVTLKDGDSKKLTGLPEGLYTVEESLDTSSHYITDYYKVSYDKATNGNVFATGSSNIISGEIVGGHEAKISYTNTYKKGNLTINKSLIQEYAKDDWESDSFSFTVSGSTALPDGEYQITVGGEAAVATVSGGIVSIKNPVISLEKGEGDTENFYKGSLLIENLPAGTYSVSEVNSKLGLDMYTTTVGEGESATAGRTVSELKIPGEGQVSADFTNSYIRGKGDLTVSKQIEVVDKNETLDDKWDMFFDFSLALTDGQLESAYGFELKSTNGTAIEADDTVISGTVGQSMTDRFYFDEADSSIKFKLRHGESVTFKQLPVGEYTVTETHTNGYNSSFDEQPDSKDSISPVTVTRGETASASCVNRYPFVYGELIIAKKITLEGELDEKPDTGKFKFKVQLSDTIAKAGNRFDTELVDASGKETSGEVTLDDELSFTVELAENESIRILNLYDCRYTVEEITEDVEKDFNVSWTLDEGENSGDGLSMSAALSPDDVDTVVFTNEYKRHLAKLEINKTGAAAIDENQSFIFNVSGEGVSMDIVLNEDNNFSAIISRLPVGEYTVTEKSGWSWRYSFAGAEGDDAVVSGAAIRIPVDDEINSLTVFNARGNDKWLNGADAKPNLFN